MEYHEAANFLFDLRRYPPSTEIEPTREVLSVLGDPHEDLTCVQVAGSNGKGSTARMVERVLREAGLDVGLYTSPHLDDLRERVRVNDRKIRKAAVCEYVAAVRDHVEARGAENDSPTFFETTTAMALWEFARRDVDVAVLEVGLGGRYDATSVVDPVASAVTSVTLEHADVLGDTIPEIAREKAQVAPDGAPLVTATDGAALAAIREEAGEVLVVGDATGGTTDPDGDRATPDVRVTYCGRDGLEGRVELVGADWAVETALPLLGATQARNAGVAAALARQVADVSETQLARGLRNAHWPGRFEVMAREPLTVVDGAHNPGACEGLAATVAEFDFEELHLVVGAMADKDVVGMADALPAPDRVYPCRPGLSRAETADVLAAIYERRDATVVRRGPDVADAVEAALDAAGPDDCVLVTGSLFTVGAARERWTRIVVPKRVESRTQARAALRDADVPARDASDTADDAVHRVVRTRLRPGQAEDLRAEFRALGGACALSAVDGDPHERVDVVCAGTLGTFERLLARLDGDGRRQLARLLRARVDGLAAAGEAGGGALSAGSRSAVPSADHGGDARGADDRESYPWERERTAVMGILNVTPDSFHDGGEYDATDVAVSHAREMAAAGADIVDVGGESTRPGADPVSVAEEKRRVLPVVEALTDVDALVSVDTRRAEVARAALEAGVDVLNDVSGLEDPEMRLVAADHDVPVVVMHSINAPVDPDADPEYDDVVEDAIDELRERVLLAEKAGLDRSQILVDPGLGFGKSRRENFELLGRIDEFRALGCPVLVGHSHKSMFALVGEAPGDAPNGTVAATAIAAMNGADVVRVHDVPENVTAVRSVAATRHPDDV